MSPEALISTAELARLATEIAIDREFLVRIEGEARDAIARLHVTPTDAGALALAGMSLHGWYTALETIFERVARTIDLSVPAGDKWHRELLVQMCAELPNVRPAILTHEMHAELLQLLSFRHFFRHAYNVVLDAARLRAELARLFAISTTVHTHLDRFSTFLMDSAAAAQR